MFKDKTHQKDFQLIVAGGVAANESIRNNLSNLSKEMNFKTIYPDLKFCGDNAAMIAAAAYYQYKKEGPLPNYLLGGYSSLDFE